MSSPAAAATTADPNAADELAWAELRHDMLLALARFGMGLAEETAKRAVNAPYHPEVHHEPCKAFASISRAVRLTLVLEARVALDLLALRRGESLKPSPARAQRPTASPQVAGDGRTREGVAESLVDREDYEDALLSGPFETCVEAIRADLGLQTLPASPATAGAQSSALLGSRPVELGPRLRGEGASDYRPIGPLHESG